MAVESIAFPPAAHVGGAESAQVFDGQSAARAGDALYAAAKRAIDLLVAVTLLIALLPVFAVICLAIRLDSGGPIFYRAERIGRFGRSFSVAKFRSMRAGADQTPHIRFIQSLMRDDATPCDLYKVTADDRITRVGRWLRRTSLDELPQLWNIVRGDMSLVGPRPDVPYAVREYNTDTAQRLQVRPGITGLWQVSGRSRLSLKDMYRLDVDYARRASLWLDLEILLRTVPVVLGHEGAA
ncbi:MAG TPA: sugar transferase [Candidatus Bathyarchaeia archaeon]|nr:sugar transferase [Candidatus Bathyarchaeia archaeon]